MIFGDAKCKWIKEIISSRIAAVDVTGIL